MTILILHGPNLNLLGLKASKLKTRLTLDKVNRAIRKHVRGKGITLKIIQTHKEYLAINFIQRNRNSADGLVIIPTSWAKYNQTILETINITELETAAVYFDDSYSFGTNEENSIFVSNKIKSFSGEPLEAIVSAIDHLANKK
ncbi:type II 3-dehydroquinate dehydratase [Candidatus Marinimicrobia bacterium]|nr:type II 3-dehydroquinate dehydratase [Candidatus Neomarinimicrobiota bacterium]